MTGVQTCALPISFKNKEFSLAGGRRGVREIGSLRRHECEGSCCWDGGSIRTRTSDGRELQKISSEPSYALSVSEFTDLPNIQEQLLSSMTRVLEQVTTMTPTVIGKNVMFYTQTSCSIVPLVGVVEIFLQWLIRFPTGFFKLKHVPLDRKSVV